MNYNFTEEELNIIINGLFLYLEKVQTQEDFDMTRNLIKILAE